MHRYFLLSSPLLSSPLLCSALLLSTAAALLGAKGAAMNYAELFEVMSDLSLSALEARQFGKKRAREGREQAADYIQREEAAAVPENEALDATSAVGASSDSRYISKALKHQVWKRDKGICTNCGGRRNIQYDHIKPRALGGLTVLKNMRLLCFHCNQRASARIFGVFGTRKVGLNERLSEKVR